MGKRFEGIRPYITILAVKRLLKRMDNKGNSDEDIEAGYILACCSHPIGAVAVEV